MQDDKFSVGLVSGVPVVTAPQEIDVTNAPELRSALLQAAADGPGTFVADMTRTRFCDSSGLHALLAAHMRPGRRRRVAARHSQCSGPTHLVSTLPIGPAAV